MKHLLSFLFCLTLFTSLFAQTQKRLALLIGNGDYVGAPLKASKNDARELEKTLDSLGFETSIRYNCDLTSIEWELNKFYNKIRKANGEGFRPVVCFYFSGYGIQVDGANYLIPVKHSIKNQADVKWNAYSLDRLLENLEKAGAAVNIVILDACRKNPFEGMKKEGLFPELGEGLAEVEVSPSATLVAYAASPGETTIDDGEGNSAYVQALLKYLPTPRILIEQVFRYVRDDVIKATQKKQIPWESSSLAKVDIYLKESSISQKEKKTRKTDEVKKPVVFVNQDMVKVEGGTFQMGDNFGEGNSDETPVHSVKLSSFYLSRYEVTFEEYDAFCNATNSEKPDDKGWGRGRMPVINVSWFDAIEYCNWRSEREGLTPCYIIRGTSVSCNWSANGYRLPTEAEWEYAARQQGQKVRFGNGKDIADTEKINFNGGEDYKQPYSEVGLFREKTVPVGSLNSPNSLGLHDMSGNVWEWCWDWKASYLSLPEIDPKGPDMGSRRVRRGGSWAGVPNVVRVADRYYSNPNLKFSVIGFRLASSGR